MREDLRSALERELGSDRSSEERFKEIEPWVPANAKVLCALNLGMCLLLDTGILRLTMKSMLKGGVKGAEMIPISHISKVSVAKSGSLYNLNIYKHQSHTGMLAGASLAFKIPGVMTLQKDNAYEFQDLLLGLIAGSGGEPKSTDSTLDKISQLKQLLDLGAITQVEFDEKKKKFMDSL